MVERSEYEAPLLVIYNAIYEVRMMLEEIGLRLRLRKGTKKKKEVETRGEAGGEGVESKKGGGGVERRGEKYL